MKVKKEIKIKHDHSKREERVAYCEYYYCGKKSIKDNEESYDSFRKPPMLSVRTIINNSSYLRRGILLLRTSVWKITRILAFAVFSVVLLQYVGPTVARAEAGVEQYSVSDTVNGYKPTSDSDGTQISYTSWLYRPENTQYVCSVSIPIRTLGASGSSFISLYTSDNDSIITYDTGALLQLSEGILNSTLPVAGDEFTEYTFDNCQLLVGNTAYIFLLTAPLHASNILEVGYLATNPDPTILRSQVFISVCGGWILNSSGSCGAGTEYTSNINIYGFTSLDNTLFLNSISFSGVASSTRSCSSGGGFFSSSTISDLGCYLGQALENTAVFLFYPASSSVGVTTFNESLESFNDVFPFNIFFGFSSLVDNLSGDYVVTDNTITWNIPAPLSKTLTISSTTIDTYIGDGNYELIRSYEENGIWIILILGILGTLGLLL